MSNEKKPKTQFSTAEMTDNFIYFRLIFCPFPLSTLVTIYKFYIQ